MSLWLIEGLDLAGKTDTTKEVIASIRARGKTLRHSRNAFAPDNPLFIRADEARRAGDEVATVGHMYVDAFEEDLRRFVLPGPEEIYLQESCWLRSVALHSVLAGGIRPESLRSAEIVRRLMSMGQFPRFDVAVFLLASLTARRERLAKRRNDSPENVDALDCWVERRPELFLKVEDALLASVRQASTRTVLIDTTSLTIEAVAATALAAFEAEP